MNVCVFSLHACPLAAKEGKETGGLNVYVLETAKELGKLGNTVDIFTRSQDARQPYEVNVSPNVKVIHLVAGPEKPISKKQLIPFIDSFVKAFFDYSKKENRIYDVLHCHYYLSGLAGIKVKQTLPIPFFVTFHTLALMKNLVARSAGEMEEATRLRAEFELTQRADYIIASSRDDKAYLKYLYDCPPEKILVINPGVDTRLFSRISKAKAKKEIGADVNRKIILAIGRIEPLKGFDALLYALKILLVRHKELRGRVCLWIVGGDISESPNLWSKELRHLEKVRRLLKITASVKFMGQQLQERLPYFYSAADVVVMPSHYESFGLVALEAMACGTPVVVSDVSGVSSLIGAERGKLVTSVNNPLLLANQIGHILTNGRILTKLRKKVSQKVQKYTWRKTALELHKIYSR